MAEVTVTAAEVRYRLRTLSSVEVPDALIASVSYDTVAGAMINNILTLNGETTSTISTDETSILKGVKIAIICKRIISSAPENGFEEGPVKFKPISAEDKKKMIEILDAEISELLDSIAFKVGISWADLITSAGGDDYHPSNEDNTQVDFSYAEEVPHDVFP